jgi:hypothetical protein
MFSLKNAENMTSHDSFHSLIVKVGDASLRRSILKHRETGWYELRYAPKCETQRRQVNTFLRRSRRGRSSESISGAGAGFHCGKPHAVLVYPAEVRADERHAIDWGGPKHFVDSA